MTLASPIAACAPRQVALPPDWSDWLECNPYAAAARSALSAELWAYVVGGAEHETVLARNRSSLDRVMLLPRMLQNVASVDLSTQVSGQALRLPVWLAPVGSVHRLHAHGHLGVRQAAESAGIGYSIGSALPESGAITASTETPAWFQLYIDGDQAWTLEQCQQARARGFGGVVITVDAPVFPVRQRDVATGNHAAERFSRGTSVWRKAFSWDELGQLIAELDGFPVIVKGLQDPRDAEKACALGVAAVWASNHGGRQWDHGPGMAELIAPLRAAMPAQVPLIVDGGFHRAEDVLKALALGADLVALGRACLLPLIAAGREGLQEYLQTLALQLQAQMTLLGCRNLVALRDLQRGISGALS